MIDKMIGAGFQSKWSIFLISRAEVSWADTEIIWDKASQQEQGSAPAWRENIKRGFKCQSPHTLTSSSHRVSTRPPCPPSRPPAEPSQQTTASTGMMFTVLVNIRMRSVMLSGLSEHQMTCFLSEEPRTFLTSTASKYHFSSDFNSAAISISLCEYFCLLVM